MKNKTINNLIKIIILAIVLIIGMQNKSNAAIIVSTDKQVDSGGTVTISVNSRQALGAYKVTITDTAGLTLISAAGGEKSSDNKTVTGSSSSGTTSLATYTFKVPEVSSDTKYNVKFKIYNMETPEVNGVSDENNTAVVTVKAKASDSSNGGGSTGGSGSSGSNDGGSTTTEQAKLTALKVNGTKKSISNSMSVTVEDKETLSIAPTTSNKESCTVTNAKNKESKTIASGKTGEIKLEKGATNKLTIKLASGKSYTLTVYNNEKTEDEPNVIDEPKETDTKILLKSLKIEGFTLEPEFSSEVYEYTINLNAEQEEITSLNIEALGEKDDYTVEITGNENFIEGKNIVTITVKSADGSVTATYKIIVNKEVKAVETVAELTTVPQEVINNPIWTTTQAILITIFTSIIAIAGIVFAVIEYKYKKEDTDEFGEIPYAKIGFEKQEKIDKEADKDLMKDSKEEQKQKEDSTFAVLNEEEMPKKKKGKHF